MVFCICIFVVYDRMSQRKECTVYDLPKKESCLSQCLYRWLTVTKGFYNTAYKLPEGLCENISQLIPQQGTVTVTRIY